MILSDKEISKYLDVSDPAHIRLATTKILEQQDIQTRQETLREVESLLSLDMNEMGFVEISNHVDYGDWQAYKDGKRGEMPEQSGTKEEMR